MQSVEKLINMSASPLLAAASHCTASGGSAYPIGPPLSCLAVPLTMPALVAVCMTNYFNAAEEYIGCCLFHTSLYACMKTP